MSETYKPYLVSADTNRLLSSWAEKNRLLVPTSSYFASLLEELRQVLGSYFNQAEIISERELVEGLNELVKESSLPVISLDRTYIEANQPQLAGFLDVTRATDENLNSIGLEGRSQALSIPAQVAKFVERYKNRPIALLDDVVFEGKTMLQVVEEFRCQGIPVEKILTGIVIGDGQRLLQENGLEVTSVVPAYVQVVDEICERDFRIGVPYSGRSVITPDGQQGAPYLLPFGKPVEWASIPEDRAVEFSLFCLWQSLQLWLEIERLSDVKIPTDKLAKPVFGLEFNESTAQAIQNTWQRLKQGER